MGLNFVFGLQMRLGNIQYLKLLPLKTYDEDGMAVQGGLMDGCLGTLEPGQKCLTCGNTSARCPGHFGHIELAEPVFTYCIY